MPFGLIIIGDEILSGKRQDKHFSKVVELLGARGLELSWAKYLGDERTRLVSTLTQTFASDRKSTRLNSSHPRLSRMPSSA